MIHEKSAQSDDMQTPGPIRVVLTRHDEESEHVVDAVVSTVEQVQLAYGDRQRNVIARSSLKPIQVLPLVSTGAADAFGVSDKELALAAASHSGEQAHLDAVGAWLKRIGLDESALECGAARPLSIDAADGVLRDGGSFERIHNCCSGKHAGFLTIAQHLGVDPSGYVERGHRVQQLVVEAIETFTGQTLADRPNGIDGCGIPTFALPLEALAHSMATLAHPIGLDTQNQDAAGRVTTALAANPYWISGTDRREVQLHAAATEPLVIKTGAEGVFMVALPKRGVGIALKARDGAVRAAELAVALVLEELDVIAAGHAVAPVTNAAGTVVGTMQAHSS